MSLHVPWTEALTGFSWGSAQGTGLEETDRVSPGTKDRRAYYWCEGADSLSSQLLSQSVNRWVCSVTGLPTLPSELGPKEQLQQQQKRGDTGSCYCCEH